MARSPLTLAALATSAVPDLDVAGAGAFGSRSSRDPVGFDQALLLAADGDTLVVRVPRARSAELRATTDLAALRALSTGIRSRLPFSVPSPVGETPFAGTRAVVYNYLEGETLSLPSLLAATPLTDSIGRALAALHGLPTSFIADSGLPTMRASDSLAGVLDVMERATATGLVPMGLVERWERATDDTALWQFAPTVINATLTADSLIRQGERITGIVDWHGLSVGDPATDLSFVLGAPDAAVAESIFASYLKARGSSDRLVIKRARLYAELEVAKWLLHGTERRSTEIVDDAVKMLHNLVDLVQYDANRSIDTDTRPVMTVREVEDMLDEAERRS